MHDVKSKEMFRQLEQKTQALLDLACEMPPEKALKLEREILADTAVDLPQEPREKGLCLARIEQQMRLEKSGVTCLGTSIVVRHSIPSESRDMMTELIFDYDKDGNLKQAYTRFADRNGARGAISLEDGAAHSLEKLLKIKERIREILEPEIKSSPTLL